MSPIRQTIEKHIDAAPPEQHGAIQALVTVKNGFRQYQGSLRRGEEGLYILTMIADAPPAQNGGKPRSIMIEAYLAADDIVEYHRPMPVDEPRIVPASAGGGRILPGLGH